MVEDGRDGVFPTRALASFLDSLRNRDAPVVLDLGAVRRCGEEHGAFDVAVGPVNGVHLFGRQLTVTATEMLEAARLLSAPRLLPVHDEHKPFGPLLKIASSIRDLDGIDHGGVEIIELGLGERYEQGEHLVGREG